MSENNQNAKKWLIIGAVVLIILLLVWLTVANMAGDTDVAAVLTNPLL